MTFDMWLNILIQAALPIFLALTPTAMANAEHMHAPFAFQDENNDALVNELPDLELSSGIKKTIYDTEDDTTEDDTEGMIAGELSRLGSQYGIESSSDHLDSEIIYWQNRLRTAFENEASKQISNYLDDYGHIESKISIGDGFEPTFDLKALLPLWESDEDLLFFQSSMNSLGKHDDDARNILNFGIGYRHWNDTFMYGLNGFYDHDITRGHQRLSVGTELWADNMKLGSNFYIPVSGWKESTTLNNYEERPAYGVDLRTNVYFPSYPEFEGQLAFEQYFGSDVGIKSDTERHSNPMQASIGIGWHPIPLLTTKLGHSIRSGGAQDTKISFGIEWLIGATWDQMINPELVTQQRTLAGMRHDFIERNNEIVLEYREKVTPIEIHHAPITAVSGSSVDLSPSISGGEPASFRWYSSSPKLQAQLDLTDTSKKDIHITTPSLSVSELEEQYELYLEVTDKYGNTWTSEMIPITVVADLSSIKNSIRFINESLNIKLIQGEPVDVEWVMERTLGDESVIVSPGNINLSTTFSDQVVVENLSGYENSDGTWINVVRMTLLSSDGMDNNAKGMLIVNSTDPDFSDHSAVGRVNVTLAGVNISDGVKVVIVGEALSGAVLRAHFECQTICTTPLDGYLWQIETNPESGVFEDIKGENLQQLVVKPEYQRRRIRVGVNAKTTVVPPRLVAKHTKI